MDKEFVAFDTETTGLTNEAEIIGFSICAELDIAYYVVLSYWDKDQNRLIATEAKEGAKAFLSELVSKKLIMHNAPFDCRQVKNNFQVQLMPSVHTDTQALAHLVDENRSCGLKPLSVTLFGAKSDTEQKETKESVLKNGGKLTKADYELYKADWEVLAKYGAKDALLTLKLFYTLVPQLYEQKLDRFFYAEEIMPLLRGPTYDLNTTGLRVDPDKLQALKLQLETDIVESKAFIETEIASYVKEAYPGTKKGNHFNIGASQQLSWLLFERLKCDFTLLTDEGKVICKFLGLKLPYTPAARRQFKEICTKNLGAEYAPGIRPKKIGNWWKYTQCGKLALEVIAKEFNWVKRLLAYKKDCKLLSTYVASLQSKVIYNTVYPDFLQQGTTSGRYSSRGPNFQNLPRDDKRVKSCIVSRPGNVFVAVDYPQLEPRVFAAISQDPFLLKCFESGEDFYSVIGMQVFNHPECSAFKKDANSFAGMFPEERQVSKAIALAATYGTTPAKMSQMLDRPIVECREIINDYFQAFPAVRQMMLNSHKQAIERGQVENLYGRPRRMPAAMEIPAVYGNTPHEELPYRVRTLLNLAVNHRIQSTAASIVNRAAIAFWLRCRELGRTDDPRWKQVRIILQVHDEIVAECPEGIANAASQELKYAMENTASLPGVKLPCEPKIANNLADLK